MAKNRGLHTFFKENSLSLVLFGFFFVFLIGLGITGYIQHNEQLEEHGQSAISLVQYILSGDFIEAVFENWESEFLQMGALVVLTIFLRQKGSADSKKLRGESEVDTSSRYSIIHGTDWRRRGRAVRSFFASNSLSLVLFGLFLASFVLHAIGGTNAHNDEAVWHGEEAISVLTYVTTAQFWYESFQNWQSEFLAVGALLVLSVFLRQRGSPESKPVGAPNAKTGE
jgi:hypothetical protein